MTNPTSNFGWQMPISTDLVTDLPADFEVFGQAVDTDFVDLLGGTTGQVLSKTSATDLDFTWVTANPGDITGVTAGTGISGGGTSGTVTVTNDMATTITAAGDIVVGTGSGTYDNLPIGTTAQVLTADTTVSPYKVKWSTAASGDFVKIVTGTFTSVTTTTTTFDGAFTSTYRSYLVVISNLTTSNTGASALMQFRASAATLSGAAYVYANFGYKGDGTLQNITGNGSTSISLGTTYGTTVEGISAAINVYGKGAGTTTPKFSGTVCRTYEGTGAAIGGQYSTAGAFDGVIFSSSAGTVSGTVTIYGMVN